MRKTAALLLVLIAAVSCITDKETASIKDLSEAFENPPQEYGPYVWWHWMGSNFSKDGIKRDLEAMKESGIAGATIFNIASAVQESHAPIENNPWPEQTYRSEAYWEAIEYAAQTAEELGLKIGLHNTPGYSTTGGPWIDEEKGMQKVVLSTVKVAGGSHVEKELSIPELPVSGGWGASGKQATLYKDIAVMAVPDKAGVKPEDVINISDAMDAEGKLSWDAPEGRWTIMRIGYAPTMVNPHPLPDDLIGKVLEADKMSKEVSEYHWDNVLAPLKEHLGQYFGKSFTHILIDSYEAGNQDWTPGFGEEFSRICGYDILPFLALSRLYPEDSTYDSFKEDYAKVINRLYTDNGWTTARDKIHEYGLQFFWEPYYGPFDTKEGTALADQPMGEFWAGGEGEIDKDIVEAAKESGKRIVGAEAFTGRPEISHYTEDPAALKYSADGSFVAGVNRLFLHHWVHQPFDDRYQPGMGMGWWGTHFSRNQTWFEPGKAFFRYLTRCQMLLQQGTFEENGDGFVHRKTDDADLFFVINQNDSIVERTVVSAAENCKTELWDAYTGKIYDASTVSEMRGDSIAVTVSLKPTESMFIVFDRSGKKIPAEKIFVAAESKPVAIEGSWDVVFKPKMDEEFKKENFSLSDFSESDDDQIRYFAGTAVYSKTVAIEPGSLKKGERVMLDLGEMNDIAELTVNGKSAGVLWNPPYVGDITPYVKEGDNKIEIAVTNNWANRLIGDEQYEPDFEWGKDRGEDMGRAMKAFPDWFIKGEPRPSKDRKCFVIWSYFRKDSPLEKAGLDGPVRLIYEKE